MKSWDNSKKEYIETPIEIQNFLKEIDSVCKKYNYSIGHQDAHGAFQIEEYDEDNIDWLNNVNICLT